MEDNLSFLDELPVENTQDSNQQEVAPIEDQHVEVVDENIKRLEKQVYDNRKWAQEGSRKIASGVKKIERYIEEGVLSEEEGSALIEALKTEIDEVVEKPKSDAMIEIAHKELQNYKKYSKDKDVDDKIQAFEFFLRTSKKQDVDKFFDELDGLEDHEVLARILDIGEENLKSDYSDIKKHGGYKQYTSVLRKENEKMKKEIEKLNKRLNEEREFSSNQGFIHESSPAPLSRGSKEDIFDMIP